MCLIVGVSLVAGASRYIAIPIDEIDIIEVNPISHQAPRYPRQTETYVPALVSGIHHEDLENPSPRIPRSDAHVMDYVDFGAHTGNNGAYSWYADYPTHHWFLFSSTQKEI